MKPGTKVRWKAPVCEGRVVRVRRDDNDEVADLLVGFVDADGGSQERWFSPAELTEIQEAQQ